LRLAVLHEHVRSLFRAPCRVRSKAALLSCRPALVLRDNGPERRNRCAGSSTTLLRYKSLSHGPIPKTLDFEHLEQALASLPPILKASRVEGRSVCVIVPTKHEAFTVDKGLRGEKISTTILGPNERDKPDSTSVRVATMHRAKGLEFDEVVLLIPRKASDLKPSADTIQRLKYVAITRAKRFATVLQY
jgi:DNA helicase IV